MTVKDELRGICEISASPFAHWVVMVEVLGRDGRWHLHGSKYAIQYTFLGLGEHMSKCCGAVSDKERWGRTERAVSMPFFLRKMRWMAPIIGRVQEEWVRVCERYCTSAEESLPEAYFSMKSLVELARASGDGL